MSERITRRTEWDGTFSLLLDGAVVIERQSLEVVQAGRDYLEVSMRLHPEQYFLLDTKPKP
jgi:DNA integrity scanning protein DisA with diadenylate cyclase activity